MAGRQRARFVADLPSQRQWMEFRWNTGTLGKGIDGSMVNILAASDCKIGGALVPVDMLDASRNRGWRDG